MQYDESVSRKYLACCKSLRVVKWSDDQHSKMPLLPSSSSHPNAPPLTSLPTPLSLRETLVIWVIIGVNPLITVVSCCQYFTVIKPSAVLQYGNGVPIWRRSGFIPTSRLKEQKYYAKWQLYVITIPSLLFTIYHHFCVAMLTPSSLPPLSAYLQYIFLLSYLEPCSHPSSFFAPLLTRHTSFTPL